MKQVAIVEDDAQLRKTLARLMRTFGYVVTAQAENGQEALRLVGEHQLDLILTDCQMPELDGISFVRALRARGDMTPVIMLSGQSDPAVVKTALKAGVNHYVPKPLNVNILYDMLQQIAEKVSHAA